MTHPGRTLQHRRIDSDGVQLHTLVAGDGPPVVLLHGFPENGYAWRHQIPALTDAGFSAWVPNLRGYPPSDIPPRQSAYHLRHLVNDVAAIVAATGYPKAAVVGHDWGGIIAWAFAGAHAPLLDQLAILNAPHLGVYQSKLWRTSQLLRSAYIGFFQLPWLPERLLSAAHCAVFRCMFRSLVARKDTFSDQDLAHYLDAFAFPGALKAALDYYRENLRPGARRLANPVRVEAPVLVIWGERDPALGVFLLDGLERYAPRLRICRLPQAGHWVQNEASNEVNAALLAFLRHQTTPGKDCK